MFVCWVGLGCGRVAEREGEGEALTLVSSLVWELFIDAGAAAETRGRDKRNSG